MKPPKVASSKDNALKVLCREVTRFEIPTLNKAGPKRITLQDPID